MPLIRIYFEFYKRVVNVDFVVWVELLVEGVFYLLLSFFGSDLRK